MSYSRILTIQDISCLGQCSMTVALPILSACGVETCILPSAVLSTHTGGFQNFHVCDLTDQIPAIHRHWQAENILFDTIYTGYLGSTRQIDMVLNIFRTMVKEDGKIVVDPAMADHGKLYYGFDQAYVDAMAKLCSEADILVPNITEACMLCGEDYREEYTEDWIRDLMAKLYRQTGATIVLTGVALQEGMTGIAVLENGEFWHYAHKKITKSYHGTGDVYSSAFVGALSRGLSLRDSVQIAGDYTLACIENTLDDPDHWYGVKFETAIPFLVNRLER